jgi:transposase-like protein
VPGVEDLLFERGIDVCHETVRFWWSRFGRRSSRRSNAAQLPSSPAQGRGVKLMKRLMQRYGRPEKVVTDGL